MEDPMSFDARSILDALVRGGSGPQQSAQGGNPDLQSISEIFRQFTGEQPASGSERDAAPPGPISGRRGAPPDQPEDQRGGSPPDRDTRAANRDTGPASDEDGKPGEDGNQGGGLDDLLRSILGGGQPGAPGAGGGLGEILGKLQQQVGQGGGGLGEILGQVFGQAAGGVREGAGRLDDATGASRFSREAISQATGRSPEELLAQIREMIANNQFGAGAAVGGLGGLLLGTSTGRSLAASAAKLGGLALIGGLAYKAYQNYQQGRPMPAGPEAQQQPLLAAPAGSGFEPGAVTHEQAVTLVRAMIAAAAADGRIDQNEQAKILGGLKQAGLESAAHQFLAEEVNGPATVEDLAEAVSSPEEAVQVYTAARLAVDADNPQEHAFLAALARSLDIDSGLAAHIEQTARSAGA
jgi:uncharacterized membrane protein YebE (DUF533 family)